MRKLRPANPDLPNTANVTVLEILGEDLMPIEERVPVEHQKPRAKLPRTKGQNGKKSTKSLINDRAKSEERQKKLRSLSPQGSRGGSR